MALATNRSRAKRSPYSSLADQLYPEDRPQDDSAEDDEDDAPDESENPRTPMQKAADSLYPQQAEPDDGEQSDTEETDQQGGDQDEKEQADDDEPDADEEPEEDDAARTKPKGKQKLSKYEPVQTPTQEEWKEIADIAEPMKKRTEEKDPAKALLYGHTDKDYEKRSGKKGQISELQGKLGITVTGVYDKRTEHALQAAFVSMMLPWAEKAEKETGVPALVSLGQAWLESGHGLSVPTDMNTGKSSNNYFGMNPRKGHDYVISMTRERDRKTGVTSKVARPFEVHASPGDSVMQHAQFLENGSATFRQNNPDYDTMLESRDPPVWAAGLEKAGYATGDKYAGVLNGTMRQMVGVVNRLKGNKP